MLLAIGASLSLGCPRISSAAVRSVESSPGSGVVVSADYEDVSAASAITRESGKFSLKRAMSAEERALMKFLDDFPSTKAGGIAPAAIKSRLKWGDFTIFKVSFRGAFGTSAENLPVRCARTCEVHESPNKVRGIKDPELLVSTFAFFEEERARLIAGELPRARSFPVTLRVLPENLPPGSPNPITFNVDVRPAFATKERLWVYDFGAKAWRGSAGSNAVVWNGLVKFLSGLRRVGGSGAGDYLAKEFGNPSAKHFLFSKNTFDGAAVANEVLNAADFAAAVSGWKVIVPLGVVQDGPAVRLLFSTSIELEDVQQMPLRCDVSCRVVDVDWVSYSNSVIQQPDLLRLYRAMFKKLAAGRAGQK